VKKLERPDPDAELKVMIKAIYEEHECSYGYRRIRDELTNRGLKVNHKKVVRLMKELGLKSLVKIKKYRSYKGKVGKVAPNILNRNFKAIKQIGSKGNNELEKLLSYPKDYVKYCSAMFGNKKIL